MMNPQDKTSITPLAVRMNEAAKLLNIGRTSLHHLIKSGQIPHTKLNRAVLIRIKDLEDFLKKAHKIKV